MSYLYLVLPFNESRREPPLVKAEKISGMKKIIICAIVCLCCALSASAKVSMSYTKHDGCTVVTKVDTGFFGTRTSYGLQINGVDILKPECDMYRIDIYSADTGKRVYTGLWGANGRKPYVTYLNSGKYTNAVVNHIEYFDNGKTVVAKFYRKDGKTYMLSTKQVTYDKPL